MIFITKSYSEPCQTPNMECFVKIVNSYRSLTISTKCSILDVWQGSKYASVLQHLTITSIKYLATCVIIKSVVIERFWNKEEEMCNYMKLLHTNPALANRYSKCGTNIKICYLSDIRTQVEKLKQRGTWRIFGELQITPSISKN